MDRSGNEEDGVVNENEEEIEVNNPSALTNDFKWPDHATHPLLIPWVVQQIFDYLPLKKIEKMQAVSKLWSEEAAKIIRKKKIMVFYDEEVLKHYNSVMRFTFTFPHTAFEFHTCNLNSNSKHIVDFWEQFGNSIKRLDLHQANLDGNGLERMLTTKTPNLECLFLKNLPKSFPRENNFTPVPNLKEIIFQVFPYSDLESQLCLKYLLRSLPNLEKISFLMPKFLNPANVRNYKRMMDVMFDVLTTTEFNVVLPRLSEIDIKLELTNQLVTRLLTKPFPLETLDVTLTTDAKSKLFRTYLSSLSGSLKNLSVTFWQGYQNSSSCFLPPSPPEPIATSTYRVLSRLTNLTLTSFTGSLSFITDLPNLNSCTLYAVNLLECVPQSLDKPHNLHAFKTDCVADFKTILHLAACFPTLKVLQVDGVNDDALRTIYREMPYLTELVLRRGTFTDTGISGVSAEICVDMVETTTYHDANPEKLRLDLYIGSLPNLSVLTMESPAITDLSIILGVVCCPNLKKLSLKSGVITDTGIRMLGNKMDKLLVFLDVWQCSGVSEAGRFYVKEKLSGRRVILEEAKEKSEWTPSTFQPRPDRFVVPSKWRREGPGKCILTHSGLGFHQFARPGLDLAQERLSMLFRDGGNQDMFDQSDESDLSEANFVIQENLQDEAANVVGEEPIPQNLEPHAPIPLPEDLGAAADPIEEVPMQIDPHQAAARLRYLTEQANYMMMDDDRYNNNHERLILLRERYD